MRITTPSTKTADALSDLKRSNIKANLKHISEDDVKFTCETSKGGCGCQFTASRTDYVVSNYIYNAKRKVIGKEVACQCPQCAKWLSKSTTTAGTGTTTVTRWLVQVVGRRTIWTVKRKKNGQEVDVEVAKDNLLSKSEISSGDYSIIYEHNGTARYPYTIWNAIAKNYSKGTILAFKWLSQTVTTVSYNSNGERVESSSRTTTPTDPDKSITCYRARRNNGVEKTTKLSEFKADSENLIYYTVKDSDDVSQPHLRLKATPYSASYTRGNEHEYDSRLP